MKRRTRARSLTGVTLLLLAGMLLFWLLSMAALTLAAAEQVYERLFQQALRFGDYAEACFGLSGPGGAADGEAFLSAIRAGEAEAPAFPVYEAGRSGGAFSLTAIPEPVFQTAVLFADGEGRLLAAPAAAGGGRVDVRGPEGAPVRFESPKALLLACAAEGFQLTYGSNLRTIVLISERSYAAPPGEAEAPAIRMYTAAVAHPLKSAVLGLRRVYLPFALLGLALVFGLRGILHRRLLLPLETAARSMAGGWQPLSPERGFLPWREPAALYEEYEKERDRRRWDANELQRLRRALDYAREAERQRREFTSGLAHELKTPLAVIHSYAEGLKARIAEDRREQYLDTVLAEAERMDGLVMELLDLSRLEAGRVRLSRDDFDLRALAEGLLEKLRPLAEERRLETVLAPGEACPVTADEGRIAQAAENLLTNALRYAPEGSRVEVAVDVCESGTRFRAANPVEKPFTAEELSRVWEPFWRRDRAGGGTGLGLPIVKNVLELHGGVCAAREIPGGVEFSFLLPP